MVQSAAWHHGRITQLEAVVAEALMQTCALFASGQTGQTCSRHAEMSPKHAWHSPPWQVTGEQLLGALENGVSQWPKHEGRFPQVHFSRLLRFTKIVLAFQCSSSTTGCNCWRPALQPAGNEHLQCQIFHCAS
jgi:hypothetical protein